MKKIRILVYAGDSRQNVPFCGPKTQRRLRRAVDLVISLTKTDPNTLFTIYLAAGQKPKAGWKRTFREAMRLQCKHRLETEKAKGTIRRVPEIACIGTETTWNTFQETQAMATMLQTEDAHEIYVVSSGCHIPRIWLIWKFMGTFKMHCVGTTATYDKADNCIEIFISICYEIAATCKLLWRGITVLCRRLLQKVKKIVVTKRYRREPLVQYA